MACISAPVAYNATEDVWKWNALWVPNKWQLKRTYHLIIDTSKLPSACWWDDHRTGDEELQENILTAYMWQSIAVKKPPKGQWFCPDCKKLPQFSLYLPLPIAHKIEMMLHAVPQQQLLHAPCPVLSMHSLHHMLVGIQLGRPPTSMTQADLTVGVQSGWLVSCRSAGCPVEHKKSYKY